MNAFRTMQTAGFLKSLLDLAFWGIVVVAPLYAALVLVGHLVQGDPDLALGAGVWFDPTPGSLVLQGDGDRTARIVGAVGSVRFQQLPWPEVAGLLALSLLKTGLWLPVLHQLRKLFGALHLGRPFVRENADRLRALGWVLILTELARTVLQLGEGLYVVWRFDRPGLERWPRAVELPPAGLFVGVALLVAAEAFRRGAQLEEDQAFTV